MLGFLPSFKEGITSLFGGGVDMSSWSPERKRFYEQYGYDRGPLMRSPMDAMRPTIVGEDLLGRPITEEEANRPTDFQYTQGDPSRSYVFGDMTAPGVGSVPKVKQVITETDDDQPNKSVTTIDYSGTESLPNETRRPVAPDNTYQSFGDIKTAPRNPRIGMGPEDLYPNDYSNQQLYDRATSRLQNFGKFGVDPVVTEARAGQAFGENLPYETGGATQSAIHPRGYNYEQRVVDGPESPEMGIAPYTSFTPPVDEDLNQTMNAIMMAESGGDHNAHNPGTDAVPEDSLGLFQINWDFWGDKEPNQWDIIPYDIINNATKYILGRDLRREDLFNPDVNTAAAYAIQESEGFKPWSVYTSGAYKEKLPGLEGKYNQFRRFGEKAVDKGMGLLEDIPDYAGRAGNWLMNYGGILDAPSIQDAIDDVGSVVNVGSGILDDATNFGQNVLDSAGQFAGQAVDVGEDIIEKIPLIVEDIQTKLPPMDWESISNAAREKGLDVADIVTDIAQNGKEAILNYGGILDAPSIQTIIDTLKEWDRKDIDAAGKFFSRELGNVQETFEPVIDTAEDIIGNIKEFDYGGAYNRFKGGVESVTEPIEEFVKSIPLEEKIIDPIKDWKYSDEIAQGLGTVFGWTNPYRYLQEGGALDRLLQSGEEEARDRILAQEALGDDTVGLLEMGYGLEGEGLLGKSPAEITGADSNEEVKVLASDLIQREDDSSGLPSSATTPDNSIFNKADTEKVIKEDVDSNRIWANFPLDIDGKRERYLQAHNEIIKKLSILNAIAALTGAPSMAPQFLELASEKFQKLEDFEGADRLANIAKVVYFDESGQLDLPTTKQEVFNRAIAAGASIPEAQTMSGQLVEKAKKVQFYRDDGQGNWDVIRLDPNEEPPEGQDWIEGKPSGDPPSLDLMTGSSYAPSALEKDLNLLSETQAAWSRETDPAKKAAFRERVELIKRKLNNSSAQKSSYALFDSLNKYFDRRFKRTVTGAYDQAKLKRLGIDPNATNVFAEWLKTSEGAAVLGLLHSQAQTDIIDMIGAGDLIDAGAITDL